GLLRQGPQEGRDQGSAAGHDEERSPGDPGHVPRLRNQDLQDREALLALALRTRGGPPTRARRPAGVGGTRALISVSRRVATSAGGSSGRESPSSGTKNSTLTRGRRGNRA